MSQITENDQILWERWFKDRDSQAGDELMRLYLPLVDYHVQRLSVGLPKNVNKGDLRSHGMFGLYDALEKFDLGRELKFDTYASFRIRGSIIDGLRQEDWLPRSLRERIKKVDTAIEKLEQKLGRHVQPKEVAEDLSMTEEEVLQVMNEMLGSHLLSIDEKASDSDRDETFKNTIMDISSQTPEQELINKANYEDLIKVIEELNEKEQLVISLFYFEELTLTEIGQVMDLSTSRISQIHSKALFRLKKVLKKPMP